MTDEPCSGVRVELLICVSHRRAVLIERRDNETVVAKQLRGPLKEARVVMEPPDVMRLGESANEVFDQLKPDATAGDERMVRHVIARRPNVRLDDHPVRAVLGGSRPRHRGGVLSQSDVNADGDAPGHPDVREQPRPRPPRQPNVAGVRELIEVQLPEGDFRDVRVGELPPQVFDRDP